VVHLKEKLKRTREERMKNIAKLLKQTDASSKETFKVLDHA